MILQAIIELIVTRLIRENIEFIFDNATVNHAIRARFKFKIDIYYHGFKYCSIFQILNILKFQNGEKEQILDISNPELSNQIIELIQKAKNDNF